MQTQFGTAPSGALHSVFPGNDKPIGKVEDEVMSTRFEQLIKDEEPMGMSLIADKGKEPESLAELQNHNFNQNDDQSPMMLNAIQQLITQLIAQLKQPATA